MLKSTSIDAPNIATNTTAAEAPIFQAQPLKWRWEVVTVTLMLHLAALLALLPQFFSWKAVAVAVLLHCITLGLGVSLGFHRLASHRSFKLPKLLEYFFILCGTLAAQGSVKGWVGYHRMHHLYTANTIRFCRSL